MSLIEHEWEKGDGRERRLYVAIGDHPPLVKEPGVPPADRLPAAPRGDPPPCRKGAGGLALLYDELGAVGMRRAILRTVAYYVILAVHTSSFAGDHGDIPITDEIIFPFKTFIDLPAYVQIRGTLFADWLGYKQNTYSILCTSAECLVASVNQIGSKQVGVIDGPTSYPILKWADREIIAQDDDLCARETITIDRVSQTVLFTWIPINQSIEFCQHFKHWEPRSATIENPMFWKLH